MEKSPSESSLCRTRLVPLTSEIQIAMMEFSSEDQTSRDLTEMVRNEVEKSLQSLLDNKMESCIKREDISEIINECLQNQLPARIPAEPGNTATISSSRSDDRNMEVTIQFVDNDPNNEQHALKENFLILEQRIGMLESRLSSVFQLIPRMKRISADFKIDRKALQQSIEECMLSKKSNLMMTADDSPKTPVERPKINPYDDMFYEWRQNKMNLTHYKKSECTLQLNRNIEMEAFHGPPANNKLPAFNGTGPKSFKVKFIKSQDLLKGVK